MPLIFVLIKTVHLVRVINCVVLTQQFLCFSLPHPLQPIAPLPTGCAWVLATQPTLYFSQYLGLIIAVMF